MRRLTRILMMAVLLASMILPVLDDPAKSALAKQSPYVVSPIGDYGDAPDETSACGVAGGIGHFPTKFNSINAAPGRDAPYHENVLDAWIGGLPDVPTTEAAPLQPPCDWVTPPQDDSGPVTLCLVPACNSGWAGTFGGGGIFGPPPVPPPGGWVNGWFVFPVSAAAVAPQLTRYVNVAVDWNHSGRWGDVALEHPLTNAAVNLAPGGSQVMTTLIFPTYVWNDGHKWGFAPFWSRFTIARQQVPGVWDGSGPAGGFGFDGTNDLVVVGDPAAPRCIGVTGFNDMCLYDWFYPYVHELATLRAISGYPCGHVPGEPCLPPDNSPYFRPNSNITRGQATKILMLALGIPVIQGGQIFEDVPPGDPFFEYIRTLSILHVVGGYACGGPGEPCVPPANRAYFRPNNNITRGQASKMVVLAKGWSEIDPQTPTFRDVPRDSAFYTFVETAHAQGLLSGYNCGGGGEPCPGSYFRPNNSVTRAQASKIIDLSREETEATPTPAPPLPTFTEVSHNTPTPIESATAIATATATVNTATPTRTSVPTNTAVPTHPPVETVTATATATVRGTPGMPYGANNVLSSIEISVEDQNMK